MVDGSVFFLLSSADGTLRRLTAGMSLSMCRSKALNRFVPRIFMPLQHFSAHILEKLGESGILAGRHQQIVKLGKVVGFAVQMSVSRKLRSLGTLTISSCIAELDSQPRYAWCPIGLAIGDARSCR